MVVRKDKQIIPLSSHECSEIPSRASLGISLGPLLPMVLNSIGLGERMTNGWVSTATENSLLDKDLGEENGRKDEPPDTLGAHLSTPQRESLKTYR